MSRNRAPISITLARELTPHDLAIVQALRRTRHYPDPNDPRYRLSGLHLKFTDEELRAKHEGDPGSRYIFAKTPDGALAGYMRVSVLSPEAEQPSPRVAEIGALLSPDLRSKPVLFVAVVVISVHLEGRYIPIAGEQGDRKLAEVLYERAMVFGCECECSVAVADVYVSPHANARSLAFHHRLGFRSLGYPLVIETLAGVEIHSLRMARSIKPLHSLERGADGFWYSSPTIRLRDRE